LASNAKGTIDWAGGEIDWNGADIQSNGYYYAQFESVEVECFKGQNGIGTNKGVSYYYKDAAGTNDTVVDGNKPTILKSLLGTGTNMTADYPSAVQSGSSSATSEVAAVPGLSGAGPGTDGRRPEEEEGESSSSKTSAAASQQTGSGGSGSGSGGSSGEEDSGDDSEVQQGFSQGGSNNDGTPPTGSATKLGGGVAVAVVFVAGLMML
jgi:cobalamin biosynthesis Mg chelatase CobN